MPKNNFEEEVNKMVEEATKPQRDFKVGDKVRVDKEFGDNSREFEIADIKDELKGITIKNPETGFTYKVDRSQLEGYKPNNYSTSKVHPLDNPETYLENEKPNDLSSKSDEELLELANELFNYPTNSKVQLKNGKFKWFDAADGNISMNRKDMIYNLTEALKDRENK